MSRLRYCPRCRTYHKHGEACPNAPVRKRFYKPKNTEEASARSLRAWTSAAYLIRTQRDDNRCQLCARHLLRTVDEWTRASEVHHIVPLKDGGELTDPENLISLCRWHHEYVEGHQEYIELLKDIAREQNAKQDSSLIG